MQTTDQAGSEKGAARGSGARASKHWQTLDMMLLLASPLPLSLPAHTRQRAKLQLAADSANTGVCATCGRRRQPGLWP